MGKVFAVSGKGGVGKTTIAALMVGHLQKINSVLAIDADPNSNLNDALGIPLGQTLGDLREDMVGKDDNVPGGMSKAEYVQYQLQMTLVEAESFDFLAMGRQEGPGCYCYVNNLLRTFMDGLGEKYSFIVLDNEAGMEHLSRRTTRDIDCLFIVSDASKTGLMTAKRIHDLSEAMKLNVQMYTLVLNRVDKAMMTDLKDVGKPTFDHVEIIPYDPIIERMSLEGVPVIKAPMESVASRSVKEILERVRTKRIPT